MAGKNVAEFIEIINVNTQKSKRMLKQVFLNMPVGSDQTRSGWVEKGKDNIADLSRLIPPELQATNGQKAFKMASDIEQDVRTRIEASVKEDMEKLRTDNENVRKVNESLNQEIKLLRENGTSSGDEIEKLATYMMKNHPGEVKEGSAVDSAIMLIKKLNAPGAAGAESEDSNSNSAKNKR